MELIILLLGVCIGVAITNTVFYYKTGSGTFEIIETDGDSCVGIKFTSPITSDTRTIILKNSRR